MRVYHACGDAIPEPKKWADDRCPRCRVEHVWETEGVEAADSLSVALGLGSRHKATFRKPINGRPNFDGPKPEEVKPDPVPIDADAVERELRQTTDSDPDIAHRLGIDHHKVRNVRVDRGIASCHQRKAEERREQIAAILGEHPSWTDDQVAEKIGSSSRTVKRARNALCLPKPPSRRGKRPVTSAA
jgi:hypothetical protein